MAVPSELIGATSQVTFPLSVSRALLKLWKEETVGKDEKMRMMIQG